MDLNWGIAIAAVCATVIAAIIKFKNSGKSNPGNNPFKPVSQDHCNATHKAIDEKMKLMHEDIKNTNIELGVQTTTLGEIKGLLNKK